ncbi:hypothetical protein N7528_009509 [Penicillium herquei]|nr:hypothetical protein N7528_009509 [Penicillium herquei]
MSEIIVVQSLLEWGCLAKGLKPSLPINLTGTLPPLSPSWSSHRKLSQGLFQELPRMMTRIVLWDVKG